jgi:branched-chain amino acid transport system permease protein
MVVINLLNGVSFGMILFLVASGLSLTFGVMGVLNLGHGLFYILGAFLSLELAKRGVNFWVGGIAGAAFVGLLGFLLERGFLSRLHNRLNEQVLLSIGFVYILSNIMEWIWGPSGRLGLPPAGLGGSVHVGTNSFPIYRLAILGIGAGVAAALWLVTQRTRAGAIVRAGMDDKDITRALGVNYGLVCSAVFVLGSFVGGFAGFVGSPVLATNPGMGFDLLLLSLIVIVVGGVGSVAGTLLGSLLIGCIDSFGRAYFPDLAYFTIYLAMIVVLLVKPTGLFGHARVRT